MAIEDNLYDWIMEARKRGTTKGMPPKPMAEPLPSLPPQPPKIRGAGDVVHRVAQPIARSIDSLLGTNIANCGGCAQRRKKLNEQFPFNK
jgi:hypothetical protein